jgi:hypothetical protein
MSTRIPVVPDLRLKMRAHAANDERAGLALAQSAIATRRGNIVTFADRKRAPIEGHPLSGDPDRDYDKIVALVGAEIANPSF